MFKKIFSFFLISSLCLIANAVPAKKGVFTISQPDGTELAIQLNGDEFFHYTTTEDGYLLKKNAENFYEYAELDTKNATIKSLGIKANNISKRTIEEKNLLSNIDRNVIHSYANRQRKKIAETKRSAKKTVGTVNIVPKGLVILVNFSDIKFTQANPQEYFNNLMNQENFNTNGGYGSVSDYFEASSGNKYSPEFKVVGPYTVSKTANYYATGNGIITDPDDGEYGIYNAGYMINEACSLAYADGVSFADYDLNGDKEVDYIYVIYAGHNSAEWAENVIWPHSYYVSAWVNKAQRTYGGYTIDLYACSSELRGYTGKNLSGIATFCHEFSHVLGLPDYYDTNYGTNYEKTPGEWTLMDQGSYNNNGLTPPVYSAYDRYYMGWLTPSIMNSAENVSLQDLQTTNTARVVTANGTLPSATSTSVAYYFENRQQNGWDAYLPGHGMLITKVQYNASAWASNTTNNGSTMYYDIVEANGKKSAYGDASDPFPGTANITSYTPIAQYPLTNITEKDGVISFKFMGGIDCEGYTIYFSGDDCDITDGENCVTEGATYIATITPKSGYTLTQNDILITMGGNDLVPGVDFTYTGTTLTIANVTGNLEIIAIAQKDPNTSNQNVYTKVTQEFSDWSGEYLIVYEEESLIFNGSLTTLDAISNFKEVTITDNTIEATPNDAFQFIIEKVNNGYTIKSASGYYIGNSSNANSLKSSTSNAYINTISLGSDGVSIVSSSSHLRFNTQSGQDRFRYYKSTTYSAQKPVALYKKQISNTTKLETLENNDEITIVPKENSINIKNIPNNSLIKIFNLSGQIIYTQNVQTNEQTYHLQKGIYIVQIINNNINKTIKAIVK